MSGTRSLQSHIARRYVLRQDMYVATVDLRKREQATEIRSTGESQCWKWVRNSRSSKLLVILTPCYFYSGVSLTKGTLVALKIRTLYMITPLVFFFFHSL
jgi:hypothetical protein